ncbi:MAG: phage tail tube protein [bacterium]
MALLVHPGYRGLADIPGVGQVRFSDANMSAKQEVNAPDLVMGDWDRDAYNYGPIEVGGSISGPVTETFVLGSGGGTGLWDWGVKRNSPCGELNPADVTLYYYCGGSEQRAREFIEMYVNSLNFSCSAGDVANFSIDTMSKSVGPWLSTDPPHYTDAEKLITWDKVYVSISPGDEDVTVPVNIGYSNFDFTITNNLETVYSLSQSNLFPYEIVPGLRTISGSISVYDTPQFDGVISFDDYDAANIGTISFDIGGLSIEMKARFHRVEPASSTGNIVSTVGFTGVGHQTGSAWE